jgi:hypothetical protein
MERRVGLRFANPTYTYAGADLYDLSLDELMKR